MRFKKLLAGLVSGITIAVGIPLSAGAAPAYTLFGEASIVSPGSSSAAAIQTVSDAEPGAGGIDFDVDAGLTFANLTTLATDYDVSNDDCGGGSPRFQINIDTTGDGNADGNVHVAIGPSPDFTDCAAGWQNTGNVIGNNDAGRYDFSQFGGSTFTTYSNAPDNVLSGTVVGIQLVTDASWSAAATGGDGEQTVLFDNVVINSSTYTFELVKVTINKFIDGAMATATSANNAAFPMQSSWATTNIGSGSGSYTLSPAGFNSPTPYQAITSNMSQGANYSTNEVTNGPVVVANCTPNGAPFALVGYTTGSTLAEAQAATPTATPPSFTNLQNDRFVIVWNKTCTTPTNKDQCKKDGWKTYGYFKNQGDCVSFIATGGRNQPSNAPTF